LQYSKATNTVAEQMSNQLAADMAAISPVVEKPLVEKYVAVLWSSFFGFFFHVVFV